MITVNWEPKDHGHGAFRAYDEKELVGSMHVRIIDNSLNAMHTEVDHAYEGKGIAHQLLNSMVAYARENNLKVIPLCPFVLAEFKRHPELYTDLWQEGK